MPSSYNFGKGAPRSNTAPVSGLLSPGGGRDAARLRAMHRSTASSSEPSLVPVMDDTRLSECHSLLLFLLLDF
jgi:hypothetical protein